MEVSELPNPFDYANPVRDRSLFAGRQSELKKIFYSISQVSTDHPVGYLAVTGERAAGKTSLLNIAEILARREGRVAVRVDLVPGDDDPVTFFSKLYDELIAALSSTGQMADVGGEPITARMVRKIIHGGASSENFPLEFPESLHHATHGGSLSELSLRADLSYLVQLVCQPIVFLIDEAQELAKSERVLSILRAIGMRLQGYVFILAGTSDLVDRINDVFSPFLRQFEIISVERFAELSDLRSCISCPLKTVGLMPGDCFDNFENALQDLMGLTGGSPYELQLFCHVLFARWQAGLEEKLSLTPDAVDDVRRLLESSHDVGNRPIISAIRRLSSEPLAALYLFCSCRGKATFDEVWFAYNVATEVRFSRESLRSHLDALVADGLVEIKPDGCIDFNGDMFDLVYMKVWARTHGDPPPPNVILGAARFRILLGQRIARLVADLIPDSMKALETCCYESSPREMREAYEMLSMDDCPAQFPVFGGYVFCAGADAGLPDYLTITEITCKYESASAVRWVFDKRENAYNLSDDQRFAAVAQRLASLGGILRAESLRIGPCNWPSLLAWAGNAPTQDREHITSHLDDRGYEEYGQGDHAKALDYFKMAFRLAPSWRAANNYAYILLSEAAFVPAMEWASKAVDLAATPEDKALSRYNRAIALFGGKQYSAARDEIASAESDLAASDNRSACFGYLLVAMLIDGKIELNEVQNANLAEACGTLRDLLNMMSRFPSISPGDDPVL